MFRQLESGCGSCHGVDGRFIHSILGYVAWCVPICYVMRTHLATCIEQSGMDILRVGVGRKSIIMTAADIVFPIAGRGGGER